MGPIFFYIILYIVLFVLVSLPLQYLFGKNKTIHNDPNIKLPPGKTGLPLIGETWTYLSMAKKDLVYRFIAERKLKFSAPKIFQTSLLGENMAIMCTPEGNKFLFSNENKLVQAWWPTSFQNIFNPYDEPVSLEFSKKFRNLVAPPFLRPDSLQRYVGIIDSMTKKNLDIHWKGQEIVKSRSLVLHHIFVLICRIFLSVEDPETIGRLEKQLHHIAVGLISAPLDLPGTNYRRAKRASDEFRKEIKAMMKQKKIDIAEKRESPEQDLLSYMMHYTDEDGQCLTEKDIMDKVLSFMFPAHDTTSTAIVSIMNYLAELPEVYDGVLKEQIEIANTKAAGELLNWDDVRKMTYSWNVAREALRLSPPAPGGYKQALTDFHYEGFYIPKGWKIHWNTYATHRNPEYFPNPEKFDPSRFEGKGPTPYSFVPFGGGPRMCPGNEFARIEILTFMHNLVTSFKWEKVYPDEKIVCDPVPAPTKGLPLRLYPHKP